MDNRKKKSKFARVSVLHAESSDDCCELGPSAEIKVRREFRNQIDFRGTTRSLNSRMHVVAMSEIAVPKNKWKRNAGEDENTSPLLIDSINHSRLLRDRLSF